MKVQGPRRGVTADEPPGGGDEDEDEDATQRGCTAVKTSWAARFWVCLRVSEARLRCDRYIDTLPFVWGPIRDGNGLCGTNGIQLSVTVYTWQPHKDDVVLGTGHLTSASFDRRQRRGCGTSRSKACLKMATIYVVPVFHVGGKLFQNEDGVLVYEGGKVEKVEEMDIDHLNFGDLVKLLETLGFITHKRIFWLEANAIDLEDGLNLLDGDRSVRDMYNDLLMNVHASKEFHIYVEHPVDVLVPAPDPEPVLAITLAPDAPLDPAHVVPHAPTPNPPAPAPAPALAPTWLNQGNTVLS
ncbi:hypothetical protein PIB30_055703 [Stylosanthes scabra]|uniref:PB1-like domain-containing protein n=1 Tax=Stylosanthes scabra TaxID=79078 RepID=A0ABU6VHC4_9FABA|nr:hypothetical protein [Stylosanthes scabra]